MVRGQAVMISGWCALSLNYSFKTCERCGAEQFMCPGNLTATSKTELHNGMCNWIETKRKKKHGL